MLDQPVFRLESDQPVLTRRKPEDRTRLAANELAAVGGAGRGRAAAAADVAAEPDERAGKRARAHPANRVCLRGRRPDFVAPRNDRASISVSVETSGRLAVLLLVRDGVSGVWRMHLVVEDFF